MVSNKREGRPSIPCLSNRISGVCDGNIERVLSVSEF